MSGEPIIQDKIEKVYNPNDPDFGDVYVAPGKMSREGDIEFGFSRDLFVPGFI